MHKLCIFKDVYAVFVLGEKDALWGRITSLFIGKYILCNVSPEKNLSVRIFLLIVGIGLKALGALKWCL